jgi:hypothetical protein
MDKQVLFNASDWTENQELSEAGEARWGGSVEQQQVSRKALKHPSQAVHFTASYEHRVVWIQVKVPYTQ